MTLKTWQKILIQITLAFIISFTILVPIHELGHYLTIKAIAPNCQITNLIPIQYITGNATLGQVEFTCEPPITTIPLLIITLMGAIPIILLGLWGLKNMPKTQKWFWATITALATLTLILEFQIPLPYRILPLIIMFTTFAILTNRRKK